MTEARQFERIFRVTDETVRAFAEVSQDKNPIHLDEKFASGTAFKGRICHGMLLASYISAIIGNDFPGIGTIYVSQSLKFKKPVRIGDEITVRVKYLDSNERGWARLETMCLNKKGEPVVEGEAFVIPPAGFQSNNPA